MVGRIFNFLIWHEHPNDLVKSLRSWEKKGVVGKWLSLQSVLFSLDSLRDLFDISLRILSNIWFEVVLEYLDTDAQMSS